MKNIFRCVLAGAIALAMFATCRPEAPPSLAPDRVVLVASVYPDMVCAQEIYTDHRAYRKVHQYAALPMATSATQKGIAGREINMQMDYGLRLSKVRKYVS